MIVNFWAVTFGFTPVYVKNEFVQLIPSTPVTTRTTSIRSSNGCANTEETRFIFEADNEDIT
ncbi:unnamed protein product [Oikopleura dioica]|uniref:Uncharacterized protein n=1 Tax=Oikopleura dioica TaxID=34765 RepID=E4XAK2_OIKDI|nr:unnamed protein product [Oikopleura dioica]